MIGVGICIGLAFFSLLGIACFRSTDYGTQETVMVLLAFVLCLSSLGAGAIFQRHIDRLPPMPAIHCAQNWMNVHSGDTVIVCIQLDRPDE